MENGLKNNRDFKRLWSGQTISVFGNQITSLAWPLTAVTFLGATPAQMGLLGLAGTLPGLFLNLLAGVWIDRLPRKPILIITNLGLAMVIGSVPVAVWLGLLSIEYMYFAEFVIGTLTVFFYVAYQSYLATLVKAEELVEGNSKLEASNSVAAVVGPGLAGALMQVVSIPFALALDALTFLSCTGFIAAIRKPETTPLKTKTERNLWHEMAQGIKLVLANPLIRATTFCASIYNLFGFLAYTAYIIYIVRELEVTPVGLGIIYGVSSVGALLGALLAGKFAKLFGVGPALVWSALLAGAVFISVPFIRGGWLLVIGGLALNRFVGSVGAVIFMINQVSLRQALTPSSLQGRVNATSRFLVNGTIPFGALLGGMAGELIGLRETLLLGAVGTLLSFLFVLFSPVRTLKELRVLSAEDEDKLQIA